MITNCFYSCQSLIIYDVLFYRKLEITQPEFYDCGFNESSCAKFLLPSMVFEHHYGHIFFLKLGGKYAHKCSEASKYARHLLNESYLI